jgi:hypothetical protein
MKNISQVVFVAFLSFNKRMLTTINNFQSETTFTVETKEDLVKAFRAADQKKLLLPTGLPFPLNIRSYFSWKDSSGVYTYLVFKKPNWDLPRGIAFKRVAHGENSTGRLCCWCHSYGSADEVGILSVALSATTSASYIVCSDLRCVEKIEENDARSGKNPETHIHQLYERMGLFFEQISNYKPDNS